MAAKPWTIRPKAELDLSDIWLSGVEIWGVERADRYMKGLFAAFDVLADFPEMARERGEFSPPVRMHSNGSHLILYVVQNDVVEIIRVLHPRQDFIALLGE
jgi:toxin ParE1/3/4